jgi:PEP-CTERM motif
VKPIHCVSAMAVALLLAVTAPAHAVPVAYVAHFSFTGMSPTSGKVTGIIGVLVYNGPSNGLYTADFIETGPDSSSLLFGDGTPGSDVFTNMFTVTNGRITAATYFATIGTFAAVHLYYFGVNELRQVSFLIENDNGFAGISFTPLTPVGSPVPEPGTAGLFATGLLGLWLSRRRGISITWSGAGRGGIRSSWRPKYARTAQEVALDDGIQSARS